MKLLFCFAGLAVVAAKDLPCLIKAKQWEELIKYVFIFLLVLAFGVLVMLDDNSPSPVKIMQSFYRDVLHLSFKP